MSERDPAAARFFAIQLVRLAGVAMVLVGLLVTARRIEALNVLPAWVGYLLIALGLVEVFVMPTVLARLWRSPPSE